MSTSALIVGPARSGVPVHLRRAVRGDRTALVEMLSRCSAETRLHRFHGYRWSFPEPYLTEAVDGRAEHHALVAETPGALVALASCRAVADGVAELAILVEDARQRQGIGSCLLRALIQHASASGLWTLKATVLADQAWLLRALRGYGTCRAMIGAGILDVTLQLDVTLRHEEDRGMDHGELEPRFAGLTTAHLADACVRAQLPVRCGPPPLRGVTPDCRLAGRVCPARHAGSVDVFLEALGRAAPGDVLVADNSGRLDEACIGDLVALEAQSAGLAGIVIWGLHRDTAEIRAIGLPVFSLGSLPAGPPRPGDPAPDALESAQVGDWRVTRDDLVFGDDDGVLFLPTARAADVLTIAETIRDTEQRQAERIRDGVSLRSQVQFDRYLAQRQQSPSLTFRDHLRAVRGAVEE